MPSPSRIREEKIRRLVVLAEKLVAGGIEYGLFDRLELAAQRAWPSTREVTLKSYVRSALRTVLSHPPAESVLPEVEQVIQKEAS
jgi:hypothetical protein